jgi:hypothetical protein
MQPFFILATSCEVTFCFKKIYVKSSYKREEDKISGNWQMQTIQAAQYTSLFLLLARNLMPLGKAASRSRSYACLIS